MKRSMLLHLAVQALGLLLSCSIASGVGLIATGAIGGTAAGVAPEFTFGLVEGLVCPADSSLEYGEIRRSYDRPGEAEPQLECVAPDGSRQDVLLPALLSVFGLGFAAGFVPALLVIGIPVALIGVLAVRLFSQICAAAPGADPSGPETG